MKKMITLFAGLSLIMSLIAQPSTPPDHIKKFAEKLQIIKDKKNRPENFRKANHFKHLKKTPKSTLELKMGLDSMIQEGINDETGYLEYYKMEFTYNDKGLNTGATEFSKDSANQAWSAEFNYTYSYNEAGLLVQEVLVSLIDTFTMKYEYAYNENNLLSLETEYYWFPDSSQWLVAYKTEYFYDENWNLTEEISSYWNEYEQLWQEGNKIEYFYDENNILLYEIYSSFNADAWVPNSKNEYTYDESGNLIQEIYYEADGILKEWIMSDKAEYTYNENDDLTEEIFSYYEIENAQWLPDYKGDYTYNTTYSFNELLLPNVFSYDLLYFNHMLESFNSYTWSDELKGWIDDGAGSCYYSEYDINASIATQIIKNVQIYPNPAVNYVMINMEKAGPCQFELYDISGRKVLSENILNNKVDLSGTGNGLYFYVVTIDGTKFSGKLMVE